MRLIDADKLKDTLLEYNYTTEHNQIFRYINEQPTAYDIDKVVDELKDEIQNGTIKIEVGNSKLFEIVRQCGVSDDVCEYKYNVALSKDIYFLTSCGHRHNGRLDNDLPYCGFCGKKIKVVE